MRTSDIARPLTAQALNETLYKQFNVKINFDKYDREQLENYRNLLRSKVHATETQANFNDLLTNETYQKDKYMLSVLNTKIKEMLGESIVLAEKAVSKAQQQAAGIALAAKRSGKKPAGKGASAEMSKMSTKELEKFAGTKHKGLPAKKTDEAMADTEEGNEFSGELAKAKASGAKSFKVDGKDYPVKEAGERTMSRAAKGVMKYGKDGMKALAKAGKEGKDLDKVRDKYNKYDESAKPDFLDMDKDGDKKEPMKKAVADKKKKPFEKIKEGSMKDAMWKDAVRMSREQFCDKWGDENGDFWDNISGDIKEATKPLKGGQKKLDTDKDGDIDAKDMKNLRSKKKVKESSELLHKAYQQFIAEGIANYIAEDEEGKAKSITAAADMVNDFTSWMQRVGNYQTKSMIELADNIRSNFGMQEAEQFKQTVGSALEGALNALTTAREEINNAVAVLAGEAPAAEPMGMEPDVGDTGMEVGGPDEMNMPGDEFAAADAAAGGETDLGRMKRESIERGNRLMKILGS
jgi:hypothetical protein